MTTDTLIDHPSQLNALSVLPHARTKGMGALRLGGTLTDHPRRAQWEAELNRHYYACGCNAGGVGLLAGIAAGIALAWLGPYGAAAGTGLTVTAAIAGALLGKLIGLAAAQQRLRHTVQEIQKEWQPREKPALEPWACG